MSLKRSLFIGFVVLITLAWVVPYPIDGYDQTGIRRLAYLRDVLNGDIQGKKILPGAMKSINDIKLNLTDGRIPDITIPSVDPELQGQIDALFSRYNPHYSIAVLEMTPGNKIRYAQRKETVGYQPGSVGKLAVAAGLFTQLAKMFPDDIDKRVELLRTKMVTAGRWALADHHTIPLYDVETQTYSRRKPQASDVFPLYEWVDHMLSVSANAAASVVWREVILMNKFGASYVDLTKEEGDAFFKNTDRSEIQDMMINVVNQPLRELGITKDEWRLGSMFTSNAKSLAPGKGGSTGTPIGLMKYLIAIEQGKFVDHWSSLELKRMMYMTARRIRYASSPALDSAAVYFKSGSYYSCQDKDSGCGRYAGDRFNYMNSVAMVEQPDGTTYAVAMMSNVLLKNSAWDHRVLAAGIDELMRSGSIMEKAETYHEGKLD